LESLIDFDAGRMKSIAWFIYASKIELSSMTATVMPIGSSEMAVKSAMSDLHEGALATSGLLKLLLH